MRPTLNDYLRLGPTWIEIHIFLQEHCNEIDPLKFFDLVIDDARFFSDNFRDFQLIKTYFNKPDIKGYYRTTYFVAVQNCILELPNYFDIIDGEYFQSYEVISEKAILGLLTLPYNLRNIKNGFDFKLYYYFINTCLSTI